MATIDHPTRKSRLMGFLSHALLIVILFILPELVMAIAMPHRRGFNIHGIFYLKTVVYIVAFYLNYLWIIDRTLGSTRGHRRFLNFCLWNLFVLAIGLTVCYLASAISFPPKPPKPGSVPPTLWQQWLKTASFLLRDSVMMILTIGLAVALRLTSKWRDLEQQKREILASQRETELDSLKSQLNPHFLFNTLNTIYALIAVDSTKAQEAVHELSALLRYMLYDDSGSVPLERECTFIENYVSLMRMRIANRPINVSIDMGEHSATLVPALLFVPLVENAFKYGTIANDDTPVRISVKASGNTLECLTENSFVASTPEARSDGRRSSGIGLANLRRRLTLIYGQSASLTTTVKGNIFTALLTVPL